MVDKVGKEKTNFVRERVEHYFHDIAFKDLFFCGMYSKEDVRYYRYYIFTF